MFGHPRSLLIAVVVLLGVALVAPLWTTRMEAPQYRNEEALEVQVYAGRVSGDLAEIHTLNEYVGVRLPLDGPELPASGWAFGVLLLAAVASVLQPVSRRRAATAALLVLMLVVGFAGGAILQFRLYQMGHERSHPILEGVEDFSTPILGRIHVANFDATMSLGLGGWAFVAAILLSGVALLSGRRQRRPEVDPKGRRAGGGEDDSAPPGSASSRRPPLQAVMGVVAGIVALLALFAAGLVLIPRFQAANPPTVLQRSDANEVGFDDLYLDLTLATPDFLEGRKLDRYFDGRDPASLLPVLVGLNTHTGTIEHMHHLPDRLTLLAPDGRSYPSLGEPIVLSQHHNAYMVLFPARDQDGRRFLDLQEGVLTVEARDLGRRPLRRFVWELPIDDGAGQQASATWAGRLALSLALVSALLVVLSPCALELTLYYSAIISCTVTEGEREAARHAGLDPRLTGRRRVLVNLGSFVAGFTLLYAASGATVGLIGEGVRQPLGEYSGLFQIIGGLLITFFALRVAGVDRWLAKRFSKIFGSLPFGGAHAGKPGTASFPGRWLAAVREKGQARAREGHGMRARDSFLVGLGLSSACMTCMGGAVLYPLLVFAGITSWYSGLVTLSLYSLAIAVPMIFIALGFYRIRLSLTKRLGLNRALRLASASMLLGIGLLILSGNERVITDVTFKALAVVSQWSV